jgi:hypothetical protein
MIYPSSERYQNYCCSFNSAIRFIYSFDFRNFLGRLHLLELFGHNPEWRQPENGTCCRGLRQQDVLSRGHYSRSNHKFHANR